MRLGSLGARGALRAVLFGELGDEIVAQGLLQLKEGARVHLDLALEEVVARRLEQVETLAADLVVVALQSVQALRKAEGLRLDDLLLLALLLLLLLLDCTFEDARQARALLFLAQVF